MKPARPTKRTARPVAEDFDVMEFLRPTDSDIKSALHTLIGPPPELISPVETEPPVEITSSVKTAPTVNLDPPVDLTVATPPAAPVALDNIKTTPAVKLVPGSNLVSAPKLDPPINSIPRKRQFAIREAKTAAEGHSRAENDVYEALWREAKPQPDGSRLITIGMLALGRISGLSESNARINLRNLQRKLALEEFATFACEYSQGRTYRVYSPDQVLARRRQAGLIWYMKRTLAVVFVDPEADAQISRG